MIISDKNQENLERVFRVLKNIEAFHVSGSPYMNNETSYLIVSPEKYQELFDAGLIEEDGTPSTTTNEEGK